jgi:hypothetical protein
MTSQLRETLVSYWNFLGSVTPRAYHARRAAAVFIAISPPVVCALFAGGPEDIYTQKLGLAISAFGTVIWGWGGYLRWWTFSFLALWAAIAAYDAWRDFVRLRNMPVTVPDAVE